MASMTVSQARSKSKTKIELKKRKFQTIVAWGANSFYEGYEKAGQLEWFDQSNPSQLCSKAYTTNEQQPNTKGTFRKEPSLPGAILGDCNDKPDLI